MKQLNELNVYKCLNKKIKHGQILKSGWGLVPLVVKQRGVFDRCLSPRGVSLGQMQTVLSFSGL